MNYGSNGATLILIVFLFGVPGYAEEGRRASDAQCTQLPSLYENWKKAVAEEIGGRDVSDEEVRQYAARQRDGRLRTLPNPFVKIARMSGQERAVARERVLWEDKEIMVLVDRFDGTPKALIIPKADGIWLPTDASEELLGRIAVVAGLISDSFVRVAGKGCATPATSQIYIHRPSQLGVQQLHVHVKPSWTISQAAAKDFYDGVEKDLAAKLTEP